MIPGLRGIAYRLSSLRSWASRRLLIGRVGSADFSIVAANCWGGEAYEELGRRYNTPFVGLFLHVPCYVSLLSDLSGHLAADLCFAASSRYVGRVSYPVGLLKDAEVHFLHYKDEVEAREKWTRRLARMSRDPAKLRIMMSDRDVCSERLLQEFERLPFPHKVVFTARSFPELLHAVWMEESRNDPFVAPGDRLFQECKKRFDIADWLRGGSGKPGPAYRLAHRLLG